MDVQALDQGFSRLADSPTALQHAGHEFRDWLIASDEIQRLRINPHHVSEAKDIPVEDVVTLALRGVAAGLFDMHWLMHCPHCNMITDDCENFFELTHSSDCKMCDVVFEVDILTRVEVSFSLNRLIEDVNAAAFCLPPPVLDPKVNIAVPPGETVCGTDVIDTPGRYRFFCPITLAKGILEVSGERTDEMQAFTIHQLPSFNYDETSLHARPGPISFALINNCDKVSGIFIVPDVLPDEIPLDTLPPRLTGLDVIHYQEYRDLFGHQALAESEHLQVTSVSLLFTDIAGSTAMYENIGNAAAYSFVRQHFDILFDAVESHGGFVVKTIGDAVMASFLSNEDCLACALDVRRAFDDLNGEKPHDSRMRLKLGIHCGPAILVNLNGRIDYFGSTVNKAARIQETAAPNEIVFSKEAHSECTVADALLSKNRANLLEEALSLKGIEAPQIVFRLSTFGTSGTA